MCCAVSSHRGGKIEVTSIRRAECCLAESDSLSRSDPYHFFDLFRGSNARDAAWRSTAAGGAVNYRVSVDTGGPFLLGGPEAARIRLGVPPPHRRDGSDRRHQHSAGGYRLALGWDWHARGRGSGRGEPRATGAGVRYQ
jgi:hypothetical protein